MVITMNNEYFTLKQLMSIILIDIMMWVPVAYGITMSDRTQTDVDVAQTYDAPVVESIEPEVYMKGPLTADEAPLTSIETIQEMVEKPVYSLTDAEIDLLALVTMAEAEGEPEEGKRLVIDTILNRVDSDRFPDTVYDVIYQPKAFTSMWTSRIDKCYVRDDIRQLVIEEIQSRTNDEVLFFRTDYYHSYGTELFQVGNHYFSKY